MTNYPRKNQYRGVNAHLHSFWQATGTWNRFHNAHITHLMETLREALLPLGHVAEIEESLQIRRLTGDFPRQPKADAAVYDADPRRSGVFPSFAPAADLTVAHLIEEEDTEHPYFAVTLHPLAPDLTMGDAVVWIELLSPTNKGRSDDAYAYLGKRRALLDSRLVFVELDYLHETPPTFPSLADYTRAEAGATPYRVVILDPRPTLKAGPARVYGFGVDDPIPTVTIPLSAGEQFAFDFGLPYQRMFEQGYYGYNLDYWELPLNFDRYREPDQRRIVARMLAVVDAAQRGLDRETAPFPTNDIPDAAALDAALQQIEALKR